MVFKCFSIILNGQSKYNWFLIVVPFKNQSAIEKIQIEMIFKCSTQLRSSFQMFVLMSFLTFLNGL